MKSKTSFFWRIHQLFFCFTLSIYVLTYFAFTGHWVAGFLMMSLPVVVVIHLLLCIFWFIYWPQKSLLSACALLLSFPFWARTGHFTSAKKFTEKVPKELKVLSYNVMSFDVLRYLDRSDPQNALDLLAWAKDTEADVKCFQEFYNLDTRPDFNTLQQFKKVGYKHYTVLHPKIAKYEKHFFGLAILSKYPIVKRGEMEFQDQNGMLFADIKIGTDTIRVINVHLRSLIVRFGKLKEAYQEKNYQQGKSESRKVFERIKYGFVNHAQETQWLCQWIDQSPYPVLLCGDFNETPYGYVYGQVRKRLSNAFEEVGSGFGFSYQNAPKFIRIDNQFFDPQKLQPLEFETRSDIKYSDHYPIMARYKVL